MATDTSTLRDTRSVRMHISTFMLTLLAAGAAGAFADGYRASAQDAAIAHQVQQIAASPAAAQQAAPAK